MEWSIEYVGGSWDSGSGTLRNPSQGKKSILQECLGTKSLKDEVDMDG